MAARVCPDCLQVVSVGRVLAYSNDLALAWVLPIVFSYFAFSIVAPIVLALTADLQLRSIEVAPVQHDVAAASHHPTH
jgi:hypothetical protein